MKNTEATPTTTDYIKCGIASDKHDQTCIKFAGHPGRHRFARVYNEPLSEMDCAGDAVDIDIIPPGIRQARFNQDEYRR